MARKAPLRLEDMAKFIVKEVGRTGAVEGSVSCRDYNDASNDPYVIRTYQVQNMQVSDQAGFEEEDRPHMAKSALEYLQSTIDRIKKLDFQGTEVSNSSGKFAFTGRTAVQEQRDKVYTQFLENGKSLYSPTDFSKNADAKVRLLEHYFPGQFGPNGKQNIREYQDAKVGSLFNQLYDNVKKRIANATNQQ